MNPRGKRVLIVDDEPNVRLVVRTALEVAGYAMEEAKDGYEAIARLEATAFDLVLLDLTAAKIAINRRDFDTATRLLEEALAADRYSAEANTLLGVLLESLSQDHAAYHHYKSALAAHPDYAPALDNLKRYCERFDLDFHNPAINPAAR